MVEQHKLYQIALMKLIGSSEGIKPKYTVQRERELGLDTHNIILEFIDFPIQVTVSARKAKMLSHSLWTFCMVSATFTEENTEKQLITNVINLCDKFKAMVTQKEYTLVAKAEGSDFFITLEGPPVEVYSRFGLSLQALEKRTAEKDGRA